jgi:hypothetical protein
MLANAILLFGMVLAIYGAGAGIMRTVWLYDHIKESPRWIGAAETSGAACAVECGFVRGAAIVLFAAVQIARGISALLAIALAAAIVGGALGFLFGLPRPPTAAEQEQQRAAGQTARWKLSTHLTEISDWLTKIIVGVGLVESTKAWGAFASTTGVLAGSLFESRHGSPGVIMSAVAGGAVFGFLFAYLYTQLIIAGLLAAADTGLGTPTQLATPHFQSIKASHQGIAPRMSRSRSPRALRTTHQIDVADIQVALQIAAIPFAELINRADKTIEDVRNWGRAKAILGDYPDAAKAYAYLLGMQP